MVAESLVERVRASVAETRAGFEAGGGRLEEQVPEHGEAGGAKWLVSEPGVEPAVWEGGYVCHCGEVFARGAGGGGMTAALVALLEHQHGVPVEVRPR